ncbi:Receptor protein kinase-like protein [Planoprotostelium fungivorum]|uniref:Receptor protein kinase-like protein n=1 Tax=Planoprotostelium fungivorum TaxID=1890364 RepID=A0A2P6N1R5_9EUKA|nr:Receptor protein kinase-like protein [Planoprotostelium fungivorum]
MTNLTNLNLGANAISGNLPPFLFNLTSLTILLLDGNQFKGDIPPFGLMSSLSQLRLNGNGLTGPIPKSVSHLKGLTSLELERNDLSGNLPEEVCQMTNLQSLLAYSMSINGSLPSCMRGMNQLNYLDLSANLRGLQMPNLMHLDLSSNRFTSVNLSSLRSVPLFCNLMSILRSVISTTEEVRRLSLQVSDPSQYPGLLTALTTVVLRNNRSSFEIITDDLFLYATTFNTSRSQNFTINHSMTNSTISASFPSSLVETFFESSQILRASVSVFHTNPFSSIDATTTYGPVIGVNLYGSLGLLKIDHLTQPVLIRMGTPPPLPPDTRTYLPESHPILTHRTEICDHLTNFTLGVTPIIDQTHTITPPVTTVEDFSPDTGPNIKTIIIAASRSPPAQFLGLEKQVADGKFVYNDRVHSGRCEVWRGRLNETTTVAIKKRMSKGRIEIRDVFKIGAEIGQGLSYLSSVGLFHSNVTPQKMLLSDADGAVTVKIGGISHVKKEGERVDTRDRGLHTAPEVVNGCYSQRGHSWSLGIILWSMLQSDIRQYDRMENIPERASSIISQCLRREEDIRISIKELTKRLQKAYLDGPTREERLTNSSLHDRNIYSACGGCLVDWNRSRRYASDRDSGSRDTPDNERSPRVDGKDYVR